VPPFTEDVNGAYIAFARRARGTCSEEALAMAKHLPVKNGSKTVENRYRDARGRFLTGTAPGPGRPANPYARRHAALRRALLGEVHEDDLRAIVRKVLRLAKLGNLGAVKLLFEWVLGPPPAPVDPDRLDEHELSVRRGRPSTLERLLLACDHEDEPSLATDEAEAVSWQVAETHAAPIDQQIRVMWSTVLRLLDRGHNSTRAEVPMILGAGTNEDATTAKAAAVPEPLDPAVAWEEFAATRLQWDEQAAAPADMVFASYARFCLGRGAPLLTEEQVHGWLTARGATPVTGHGYRMVKGIRVVD
jgi:hypothetical protein